MEVLVRSANELVTKDALMDRIWPRAMVGENTFHVHISAIRKALGRDRAMLKTTSGRGYRLLGDWTVRREEAAEEPVGFLEPVRTPARTFQTNLPETALELIGRTIAVRQIQSILISYRAITLTSPGGIGKNHTGATRFPPHVPYVRWRCLGCRACLAVRSRLCANGVGGRPRPGSGRR